MIAGTTKLLGVIGWPVEHSFSPAMHNAILQHTGIDCVYVPLPVEPGDLPKAIDGIKSMGFLGANVTIPHKEEVMQYLDEIHPDAQKVNAVNTIVVKDKKLIGYNTDIGGFRAALSRHHFTPKDKNVVIFGAGGAAKAIVYALAVAGCKSITVGARSQEKAEKFIEPFKQMVDIKAYNWEEQDFRKAHWDVDLLINTTPVGMDGIKDKSLPTFWTDVPLSAFAADIIYNPPITAFLRQARLRGCRGMNGLAMLVEQGALSFELWFDKEPPREIMYEFLVQKLE